MDSFTVWGGVDLSGSGDSFSSATHSNNSGVSAFAFMPPGEQSSADVAASLFSADVAGGGLDLAGSGVLAARMELLGNSTRDQQPAAALLPPRGATGSRSAADLLALLQAQQQKQQMSDADAAAREEDIDAQIQHLMQLKHVLQRQKQHAPAGQQPSLFMDGAANPMHEVEHSRHSLALGAANNHALGGLPISLGLTPSMSHDGTNVLGGLDLGAAPWPGAAASGLPRARRMSANVMSATARHSIDMGGVARRMSALVVYDGLPDPHQPLLRPQLADSLAARAASMGTPGAGLPSAASLALSSSLYGPTPAAGAPGMPPFAGRQPAGGAFCDPPLAGLVAASQGWPGAGQLDTGLTAAQAAWLAAGGIDLPCGRASLDVPLSHTPEVRAPPRKSASVLTTSSTGSGGGGSGRNSPTAGVGGRGTAGPSRSGQQPLHQAPKWAGSHWHPMADVVKSGQLANKGTGVFIPGGVKSTA